MGVSDKLKSNDYGSHEQNSQTKTDIINERNSQILSAPSSENGSRSRKLHITGSLKSHHDSLRAATKLP
jgi:hypothetical protein